jgi:hypothetical protein
MIDGKRYSKHWIDPIQQTARWILFVNAFHIAKLIPLPEHFLCSTQLKIKDTIVIYI